MQRQKTPVACTLVAGYHGKARPGDEHWAILDVKTRVENEQRISIMVTIGDSLRAVIVGGLATIVIGAASRTQAR